MIGRDGPRVLIANGDQVTLLRREWDCNFWFYVFLGWASSSYQTNIQNSRWKGVCSYWSRQEPSCYWCVPQVEQRQECQVPYHLIFSVHLCTLRQNRDGILPLFALFLLELSLRALMKFTRRKSEEKREGKANDSASSCKITLSRLF